ncbi:MAG: GAF domain-containing protein, partial [Acidimicrobiia bacterium]|nr:GAF domain-containing protein [Acidimicrobiia bacterium]
MATTTRRLARTVSRLETLFQLALDDPDGKALRAQALEFAVELTDSHGGYLHFFDDETQTIDLEVWSQEVYDYCEVEQAQHYPIESAGIWADCVRLRRPVMHNDYPNMPEEAKQGLPEGHFALYRHLAVPVIEHGKVVAIGGVGNKEEPYDHDDVEALQLFMNSMWSVLQQGTAHAAQREAMTHRQRFERLLDTVPVGVAEIDVTHVLPLLDDLPVPIEQTASWLREHPTKTLRILGAATLRASNGPMRDFLRVARLDSLDPVLGGLPNGLANLRPGVIPRWPVRDVRLGPDGEILHTDLDGAFRTDSRGAILSITA